MERLKVFGKSGKSGLVKSSQLSTSCVSYKRRTPIRTPTCLVVLLQNREFPEYQDPPFVLPIKMSSHPHLVRLNPT